MLVKRLLFVLIVFLSIKSFCIGNDLELILGQWYGASKQYQEFYDTVHTFTITKNENNYKLSFKFSSSLKIVFGDLVKTGENVNDAYTVFSFLTEKESFKFNILPASFEAHRSKINQCTFISDRFIDYWPFVKKSDLIRSLIPDLTLPEKYAERPLLGYINDDGVRFRENYGLTNKVIRTFRKNENVSILGISPAIEIIDGNYEHWYQVMTRNGIKGWVYGAYLELDGNKMLEYDNWP